MPLYAGGYSCRLAHNANTATSVPERDVTTSADGKWAACKVPPEAIFGGMCMLKLDSSLTTRDIVLPHKYDRVFIFEDGKLTGQNDFHMCGHSDLHASTRVAVDYAGVEVPRDYQRMIEIVIVSFGTKIPELALGSPNTLTKFAAQFSFRTDRPNRTMTQEARRDEKMTMNWVSITRKLPQGEGQGQSSMSSQSHDAYTSGSADLDPLTTPRISSTSDAVLNTPRPGLRTPVPAWFSQQQG